MYVAVPPDRDPEPVRVCNTFTADLKGLIDWLIQCGITTVAMESTGVYWIPLYQMLEDRGVRVCLVNARHMKNVPGRRTDWHDCQWLQYLHSTGLLRAAFRPDQDICAVRTVLWHRKEMIEMASQHVQHVQKALTQMNLQIHPVISDITGLTGRAIVDAILRGERDPMEFGQTTAPQYSSAGGDHRQILGRRLAHRTSIHAPSIPPDVRDLPAEHGSMRPGDREALKQV